MSNVRFTGLTPITRFRPGDVLAVDNPGPGSAKIAFNDAGLPIDWGVYAITNPAATLLTIPFSGALAAAPTSYNLTFLGPTGNTIVVGGTALIGTSLTQFQVQLQGPPGDAVHSVRWEAFQ